MKMQSIRRMAAPLLLALAYIIPVAGPAWSTQQVKPGKHALIVVTSHDRLGDTGKQTGWYLSELTKIYYPLAEAGFTIDIASPKGGKAPIDESSLQLDIPQNKAFLDDPALVRKIENTLRLSQVDAQKYRIVHFAGGHGTMWDFPDDKDIIRITETVYANGGIVAAICHGVSALVNVRDANGEYLVRGRDINSFTDAEEEAAGLTDAVPFLLESKLKERGAKFHAGALWANTVVVSGRIVTGQNPASAQSLGEKLVALSNSRD